MIVVGMCLFAVSVGVGVYIKAINQTKVKFKLDILNFCDYLKTQIGFAKMPLKQIVLTYAEKATTELKQILINYADELGCTKDFVINHEELNSEERAILNTLFSGLGKSDAKAQVELCENAKNLLLNSYEVYKNKRQKAGDLGLKLSICVGILCAILLI